MTDDGGRMKIRQELNELSKRLAAVGEAMPPTGMTGSMREQIHYLSRRLQSSSLKKLDGSRQLIVNHDLAAANFWLTQLEQRGIFPARRLTALQNDITGLLTRLLVLSKPRPTPPSIPPPAKKQRTPPTPTTILLDSQTYTWNGQDWFDEQFLKPPTVVMRQLNRQLTSTLLKEDLSITDINELAARARIARDNLQHERAEMLARRILALEPDNSMGATVLCASLRARNRPAAALAETEAYRHTGNPALLTTRAAAYCDLKQWPEARREVGRALAMQTSQEALSVVSRIKAARPELYRNR